MENSERLGRQGNRRLNLIPHVYQIRAQNRPATGGAETEAVYEGKSSTDLFNESTGNVKTDYVML